MLRLLSDADFNGRIFRGLMLHQPSLDLIRAQDVGLRTAADPTILEWAASQGRIVLTHDRQTMTRFAYERVRAGLPMPGVFIVDDSLPVGKMVDEILLVNACSEPDEWRNRVEFLPL